jgi:molybdopterin-synthase adenylyltransferase
MIEQIEGKSWPPGLSRNHPTLSAREQERLLASTAAVVGLGGLGGHLAILLTRAGVGHLVLADGDRYEPSNLNRQVLATTETLGQNKARVTADFCCSIHPGLRVTVQEEHFHPDRAGPLLQGVDVVMDGLDSVPVRKTLFAAARSRKIPYIHGAVSGFSGQTSTFLPESPLTLDHVYPGETFSTAPPSVLAPVVAVIAGIQALEAIRFLCGRTPANAGTLVFFDGAEISLHKIELRARDPG